MEEASRRECKKLIGLEVDEAANRTRCIEGRAITEGMRCVQPPLIKTNHTRLKLDDDDNALFV